ncbi:MAG: carbohydrate ABC transporter substrate-binding protein, partial [Oscillospiraceae bacterium]|nr:carbohydrate ABC transporter substrate-binding protein [Oscillospiraceae bacterium]
MKKFLAIVLALCMVFALCAVASAEPAKEITLWTYPIGSWGNEAVVKTFTDAFEAETGIKVSVEFLAYGGDGDNKINAANAAGEAPDMVMEGPERLAVQWGAQGHMVDLNDMLDETDKAELNPATIEAFTIADGSLTGYPLCMNAHCMAINLDAFKRAGVDHVIDL